MYFFGVIFIATTLFILIFKKEKNNKIEEKNKDDMKHTNAGLTMFETYKIIISIFKIKPIRTLALILLTVKVIYHIDFFFK
jgi:hypothetical protein